LLWFFIVTPQSYLTTIEEPSLSLSSIDVVLYVNFTPQGVRNLIYNLMAVPIRLLRSGKVASNWTLRAKGWLVEPIKGFLMSLRVPSRLRKRISSP
jgi:hypothetical protein